MVSLNNAGSPPFSYKLYPDASVVKYEYDTGGNLLRVKENTTGFVYASYTGYNASGQIGSAGFGNGVNTTYQYYSQNKRLYSITTSSFMNVRYTYDNAGNIKTITDLLNSTKSRTYGYDDLNRLTSATSSSYGGSSLYTYNKIGNMTYNCKYGNYYYNDPAHKHAVTQAGSVTYTYDANGNMTSGAGRTFTYDYDNRPTSIAYGASYVVSAYDESGSRIKKTTPSSTTVYIGKHFECTDGTCTKRILAGSQIAASIRAGETYYYHTDHLGSSSIITDEWGNKVEDIFYYPYGEIKYNTGTIDVKHKFTGQEWDAETGLYYYGARYYDPRLARFISADTIVPSAFDPQALNRYSYVLNNPIKFIDPTGHFNLFKEIGKFFDTIISSVVGFIVGGPPVAIAAAGSNLFLSHTGEGRKITQSVGKYFFDNFLGLPPDVAYIAANITLTAVLSAGITKAYNYAAGVPEAQIKPWDQLDEYQQSQLEDYQHIQGQGGLASGGGSVVETATLKGGRLYGVFNAEDNLVGFYAKAPAFGLGDFGSFLGIEHTSAILWNGTSYVSSLSGFTGANFYAGTVVCHQMTNQAFLQAGFSNTVLSMSPSFSTMLSNTIYGPYGGANVVLSTTKRKGE